VNDDTADVDRLFARLSGEGSHRDPDDHPTPEKLSAYLANELSPEEDSVLQEHLAHCTLCTELLLDLQRFLDPPAEDLPREGIADFETVAGWRELRGRMAAGAKAGEVSRPGRLRRVFGSLKVAYGLAAMLLVGLVGFSVYSLRSRQDFAGALPFYLHDSLHSRGFEEQVIPSGSLAALTLESPGTPSTVPKFQAKIRDLRDSRLVKSLEPLPFTPGEGFGLVLSTSGLRPGHYEIVVQGRGSQVPIGRYLFRIVPKASH
jgi:hypothetical protein